MNKIEAVKFKEVIKAFCEGSEVQRWDGPTKGWVDSLNPQFSEFEEYRVKPAKIEKDLEFEDILPGSVIRQKGEKTIQQIVSWDEREVIVLDYTPNSLTFEELRSYYEINRSLARGKWDSEAWEPCSK